MHEPDLCRESNNPRKPGNCNQLYSVAFAHAGTVREFIFVVNQTTCVNLVTVLNGASIEPLSCIKPRDVNLATVLNDTTSSPSREVRSSQSVVGRSTPGHWFRGNATTR